MSRFEEVTLVDASGNYIAAHATQEGDYHLGTMMQQDVYVDTNNSSTDNLVAANSYTFTGVATSTLGIVGLQWSLKTDQNATVYIEESPDGTNWDISYPFDYIASKGGRGETVQAAQAYWRIRVVLSNTTDTTYFRLDGVLCPIAVPMASALSPDGRCKSESTITGYQNEDRHAWITPLNDFAISPKYRLVGHSFSGAVKDSNFWSETVTNGGTADQVPGEIKLTTNTTANGTCKYYSVHKARFVSGYPNMFTAGISFKTALTDDNIRRCGTYNGTEGVDGDGYYFELDGSTFSVGTRKGGTDTRVSSGSFNGNYGSAWVPTAGTYYKLDIEITPMATFWYVNNILLHKVGGGHQTGTITLPITMECNNDNGQDADIEMHCVGALISREGQLTTQGVFKYIAGASTNILKYGAGTLHTIVNNDNSGSLIAYDNTAGSGTIVCSIDLAKVLGTLSFNAPFSNGLTIVSTGAGVKVTVVYE
ncbi:MAG: hypothetical protein DRP42_02750 [Tenericutes bacterium]|nr:MAG: hypothetical protein DRP42_02750 [Mycoplasmatota bacterium]